MPHGTKPENVAGKCRMERNRKMSQGNAAWNEAGKCCREMLQGTIERNIELRRNEWQNGLAPHPQQAGFGTSNQ